MPARSFPVTDPLLQSARIVARLFQDQPVRVSRLGSGNINDTFLVCSSNSFVLQCINGAVFPEPEQIMANYVKVIKHLGNAVPFRLARPLMTAEGRYTVVDSCKHLWRALEYIPYKERRQVESLTQAYSMGRILGQFHSVMKAVPPAELSDPLPGFHNLPFYMAGFEVVRNEPKGLEREDGTCREIIEKMRPMTSIFTRALEEGRLRVQVIHGDPKCDNFIFDDCGEAAGLLDLDTMGAGLIQYDIGDCLRSCCNPAGEMGKNPRFDLSLCRAILEGYRRGPGLPLMVFESVMLITFELGLRFYTDHLQGNRYFRVREDGLNLFRARRQFALLDDIRSKEKEIRLMDILSR